MANTKDTDLLIVSREGSTFKTPVSDLISVSGNISLSGETINLTKPITEINNFGPDWDETEQPLGPLYVNTGSGPVHSSWDYIGGEKIDAEIGYTVDENVAGGYLTYARREVSSETGQLKNGTQEIIITPIAGGTEAKIEVTVADGYITDTNIIHSGYLLDVTKTLVECELENADSTKQNVEFQLDYFEFKVNLTIDNSGGGFVDAIYDGSGNGNGDLEQVYGGSSSGMLLSFTALGGEVTNVDLVVLTEGYDSGNKVYITANDPSKKYGLTVSGSEVVTWLGATQNEPPEVDKGWVLFTTLASGDDDGFVRKEGDHMSGTLFMDDMGTVETPAISAKNNIVTEKTFRGQNLDVTGYVNGGNLTINENSTLYGDLTQGEPREDISDASNPTNIKIFGVTKHDDLAGYVKTDNTGEHVYFSDRLGGEDTVKIGLDDFITKRYVDAHSSSGPSGNNVEYTLNVPAQSEGSSIVDYGRIEIVEEDITTGVKDIKSVVKFTPGPNIVFKSDVDDQAIEIGADATRVIFSPTAPPYEEGQLWYNVNDGRIYVGYTDLGNDTLPATDQWVDASPSAINGGDYVYRYGDQVENYLLVNGYFNAEHYKIGLLPDISARV